MEGTQAALGVVGSSLGPARGGRRPRAVRTARTRRAEGRRTDPRVGRADDERGVEAGRGLVGDEAGDPQSAGGGGLGGVEHAGTLGARPASTTPTGYTRRKSSAPGVRSSKRASITISLFRSGNVVHVSAPWSPCGLDLVDQLGEDRERVAYHAEVGQAEDRRVASLLIATIRLEPFMPTTCWVAPLMPDRDVDLGLHGLAGLADLIAVRHPSGVDHRAARADGGARRSPRRARSSRRKLPTSCSPRPPAITTFASSSFGPAAASSCRSTAASPCVLSGISTSTVTISSRSTARLGRERLRPDEHEVGAGPSSATSTKACRRDLRCARSQPARRRVAHQRRAGRAWSRPATSRELVRRLANRMRSGPCLDELRGGRGRPAARNSS